MRDKRSAFEIAAKLIKTEERRAAGLETADAGARDVPSLIKDYLAEQLRRGRCEGHVKTTGNRVRRVLEGVSRLEDATPERVRLALTKIADAPIRRGQDTVKGKRPTAKTVNGYRTSLFGFFAWLVREGRWEKNPVMAVQRARESDPVSPRRALTPEEFEKLLDATSAPGARMGRERRVVYLVAANTGLRKKELRSLLRSQVDLDAKALVMPSNTTKNRKPLALPLTDSAVEALREHLKGKAPDDPVFDTVPTLKAIREDLTRAKIEWRDLGEGKLDFHCLRVTFCTDLARAGVPLVMAQRLMRHSDPRLTANIYSKFQLDDVREALTKLDEFRATAKATAKAKKNGRPKS